MRVAPGPSPTEWGQCRPLPVRLRPATGPPPPPPPPRSACASLTPGPHRTRQRCSGPVCDRPSASRSVPSRQIRFQAPPGAGFDGTERAGTRSDVANSAGTALTVAVRTGPQSGPDVTAVNGRHSGPRRPVPAGRQSGGRVLQAVCPTVTPYT